MFKFKHRLIAKRGNVRRSNSSEKRLCAAGGRKDVKMKLLQKLFPFEPSFKSVFCRLLCGLFLCAALFLSFNLGAVNNVQLMGEYNFPLFVICFLSFSALFLRLESDLAASWFLAALSTLYFLISAASGEDGYFSVGLCLASAAVFCFADLRLPRLVGSRKRLFVLAVFCFVGFSATVGTICSLYYQNSQTSCFDFGIFSQMFYYMKTTGKQLVTCERDGLLSHLAVHFSPIYYLMLPFYLLVPKSQTLLVLQAVVVASGVFPLALLCEEKKLPQKLSGVLVLLYVLYPAFWGGCFYYLHENCFLAPLLLWLFYFFEKEKTAGVLVFSLLTLSVKEDAAVYVAVAALFFLFAKKNLKQGLSVFVISVIYFLLVTAYLSALGDGVMTGRYDNLIFGDGGLINLLKTVFQNPALAVRELFEEEKILYLLEVMFALFFLPFSLKKPERLLLLIPLFLFNLLPDYGYQYKIGYQYGFGSGAFLIYLSLLNISDLKEEKAATEKRSILALSCSVILLFGLFAGRLGYITTYGETKGERAVIGEAFSKIEDDTSVAASAFFVPGLSQRKVIYELETTNHLDECEYIAVDMRRKYDESIFENEDFELIYFRENVAAVLKRK